MRIAFRVDSSSLIGSGHVTRCLVLARALAKRGAEPRFLCQALPGDMIAHIEACGFPVATVAVEFRAPTSGSHTSAAAGTWKISWQDDLAATQRAMSAWGLLDWLVVDHYGLDANWEGPMREVARHSMVIDDLANRLHDCDLLLDHNCGADRDRRYHGLVKSSCRALLGPEYALLPPVFDLATRRPSDRGVVRRVLVSFGGADPSDETSKAIRALVSIGRSDLDVTVAVGGSNPRWKEIAALCSAHSNIHCHQNPLNMAGLFAEADLAIGGGGVSLLERCAFALPAVIESLAPNQVPSCRALAAQGGALYLGEAAQVSSEQIAIALQTMLASPELVNHLSIQAGKVVDGRGVERVVRAMLATPIALRCADAADCDTIWKWRNHRKIRKFAKDPSKIPLDTHREWFAALLNDTSRRLLIAEDNLGKVGVVRYDITGDTANVSVFVDPHRHGQGLGSHLIGAGDAWIHATCPSVRKIIAEVHSENTRSLRAFVRAGYVTEWHRLVHDLRDLSDEDR